MRKIIVSLRCYYGNIETCGRIHNHLKGMITIPYIIKKNYMYFYHYGEICGDQAYKINYRRLL